MESTFKPGDVVQLRSGGPLMTVARTQNMDVYVIYFNTITGLFERFDTDHRCLREATTRPQSPIVPGPKGYKSSLT